MDNRKIKSETKKVIKDMDKEQLKTFKDSYTKIQNRIEIMIECINEKLNVY